MQFTLDSIAQVEAALRAANKDKKVTSVPILLSGDGLLSMVERPTNLYFGTLTCHDSNYAKLSYRGNDIIDVESGSQIIEMFSALQFMELVDGVETAVEAPKGLFRGFLIQIN